MANHIIDNILDRRFYLKYWALEIQLCHKENQHLRLIHIFSFHKNTSFGVKIILLNSTNDRQGSLRHILRLSFPI